MESRWHYERTPDNKARFILGEPGNKTLVCIGVNPSTAEPEKLDNTLTTVRRYAYSLGYDSWMMLNLYPQRATNPNDMHMDMNQLYHSSNLAAIEKLFKERECDIWAAWGTLIKKREYLTKCLLDIHALSVNSKVQWYTIGKRSIQGHPHHPLYLKKDLTMDIFDLEEYIERLMRN